MIYELTKPRGSLRYEYGNKARRLLVFQLRKLQSSRVVHKIKCPNTAEVFSQPKDVAKAFAADYQELYKEENCQNTKEKMGNLFGSLSFGKLTEEEADRSLVQSPKKKQKTAFLNSKITNLQEWMVL